MPKPIVMLPMVSLCGVLMAMMKRMPAMAARGASVEGLNRLSHAPPSALRSSRRMIFAWSGAFKKRGELDNLPELVHFGEALEAASLQTLNEGIMTKDLCGLAEGITPTAVDSEGFIKAIRERLEAKLA